MWKKNLFTMWFQDFVTVFNQSYNCQTSHYLGRNRPPTARLSILLLDPWSGVIKLTVHTVFCTLQANKPIQTSSVWKPTAICTKNIFKSLFKQILSENLFKQILFEGLFTQILFEWLTIWYLTKTNTVQSVAYGPFVMTHASTLELSIC